MLLFLQIPKFQKLQETEPISKHLRLPSSTTTASYRFIPANPMPLIDHLLGNPTIRKAIWRLWYPFLTKRLHGEGVVFLNYAYETDPPMGIPLAAEDEAQRACAQLHDRERLRHFARMPLVQPDRKRGPLRAPQGVHVPR